MDQIRANVIKKIIELPFNKQIPWRRVGFDLFCALADAKGEEAFKQEPNIIKVISAMCSDTNWKTRK